MRFNDVLCIWTYDPVIYHQIKPFVRNVTLIDSKSWFELLGSFYIQDKLYFNCSEEFALTHGLDEIHKVFLFETDIE